MTTEPPGVPGAETPGQPSLENAADDFKAAPAYLSGQLTTADRRYLSDFMAAFDMPWWWQAAGHTEEEWHRDERRRAIANKCPAQIHDQPIFCEMHVRLGADGLGRCADPHIAHVSRPTGDPDRPWRDTGRRERVS